MFFVLSGSGTLRLESSKYEIKQNDIIACPPGGQNVAHQIINTGDELLKLLCVSTNEMAEICEYPDSGKLYSMIGEQGKRTFSHIFRLSDKVDYFEGES